MKSTTDAPPLPLVVGHPTTSLKVSFYIGKIADLDCSQPEAGNPGIGGTQFTTLASAYYLKKHYPENFDVQVILDGNPILPPNLKRASASNLIDGANRAHEWNSAVFVFRAPLKANPIFGHLEKIGLRCIVRANNTPRASGLNLIDDCVAIRRLVCLSRNQIESIQWHRVLRKSTFIYHYLNLDLRFGTEVQKMPGTVVFLGSMIPAKGFHVLAKVWSSVLKEYPSAKLRVIGTGKLYDRTLTLGKWNIAIESYEKLIRRRLSNSDGSPPSSVEFLGLMGTNKIDVLKSAIVGVANPTGVSETFCSSAVEIQACRTPVLSSARTSLLDTVQHGETGFLGETADDLAKNIVYMLQNPELANHMGRRAEEFVRNKFRPDLLCAQWKKLIEDVAKEEIPIKRYSIVTQLIYFNYAKLIDLLLIARERISLWLKKLY